MQPWWQSSRLEDTMLICCGSTLGNHCRICCQQPTQPPFTDRNFTVPIKFHTRGLLLLWHTRTDFDYFWPPCQNTAWFLKIHFTRTPTCDEQGHGIYCDSIARCSKNHKTSTCITKKINWVTMTNINDNYKHKTAAFTTNAAQLTVKLQCNFCPCLLSCLPCFDTFCWASERTSWS